MGQREAARAHRAVPTASPFSSSHRHSIAFSEFPETSLAMRALRSDPCRDGGNHRQSEHCIMTISTTENREPAQATATAAGKPKPPQKARAAAKKGHAAASQATAARKPRAAKKEAPP